MPAVPSAAADKHDLGGIGDASAALVMAALAANPGTLFLTTGIQGKILFWLLSKAFTKMASVGLVILNVGAENLATAIERSKFDGSFESAERLIEEIRSTGRDMTPEEMSAIDGKVIDQFRKFAKMARKKNDAKSSP